MQRKRRENGRRFRTVRHVVGREVSDSHSIELRRVVIAPAIRHVCVDTRRGNFRVAVEIFPKHSNGVATGVEIFCKGVRVDLVLVDVHAATALLLEVVEVLACHQLAPTGA